MNEAQQKYSNMIPIHCGITAEKYANVILMHCGITEEKYANLRPMHRGITEEKGCWVLTKCCVSIRADFGRHHSKATVIYSIYVQLPAKTARIPHVGMACTTEREKAAWSEQPQY